MIKQYELAERIDETKDRLEKGDVTGEALAIELSAKWAVSIRTAHRYIAYAKDIMDDNLKRRESILQEMRLEVIGEDIRNGILSNLELEAKLCAIIEGKLLAEKIVRNREGGYERITCLPSHRDIIYAIDKLYRKRGGYNKKVQANEYPEAPMKIIVDSKEDEALVNKILNDRPQQRARESLHYSLRPKGNDHIHQQSDTAPGETDPPPV